RAEPSVLLPSYGQGADQADNRARNSLESHARFCFKISNPKPLHPTPPKARCVLGGRKVSMTIAQWNRGPGGLIALLSVVAFCSTSAQVVNDGATNTLNNVTNTVVGDVTVGTNGSFTLLILTNNALLTNSGFGTIGTNAGANSNTVLLTGTNTRWL